MQGKKFVFAGNRFFVLEEMLRRQLDIAKILAVRGSYLELEVDHERRHAPAVTSRESAFRSRFSSKKKTSPR